jgi:hypothetical protein
MSHTETEKYAHVTFFFNGGREAIFHGEDREVIPSPKVATYDLQPEMSVNGVADAVCVVATGVVMGIHDVFKFLRMCVLLFETCFFVYILSRSARVARAPLCETCFYPTTIFDVMHRW